MRSAALAALMMFGAACRDSSGPGGFAEVWELDTYEGQPVPVVTFSGGGVSSTIVEQRIVLLHDRSGVITTTTRAVDAASPQGRTESAAIPMTFSLHGTRIEITYVCPPNADCIAGPHLTGDRTETRLAVSPPTSSKPASVYRRID